MSVAKQESAVILAGGKSRRMGQDKAWMELDGVPLIGHVMARVRQVADDVVIVTNDPERYTTLGVRLVGDEIADGGPLAGLAAGLDAAQHERAIVVACDMPFLNVDLMRYLLAQAVDVDVVIPNFPSVENVGELREGKGKRGKDLDLHPLHAVYRKSCLDAIRRALARGERRLVGFHDEVRVRVVPPEVIRQFDPEGRSLLNLNTPQDFLSAQDAKR